MRFQVFAVVALALAPVAAADDFQVRLLAHHPPRDAFDIAAWVVAPDLTVAPLKGLGVVGVGTRTKSGWAELMAGRLITNGGKPQNVVNFRALAKRVRGAEYFEMMYRDPKGQPRSYRPWSVSGFATVRIAGPFSAGLESELFFGPHAPPSLGLGPRVTFTPTKKLSVALAWQFRARHGGESFLRTYNLTTF